MTIRNSPGIAECDSGVYSDGIRLTVGVVLAGSIC